MLPKITAALTQFISPVASSKSSRDSSGGSGGFRRQTAKNTPHLAVVPPPSAQQKPAAAAAPLGKGIAQAFIQLFSLFQGGRGTLNTLAGTRAYQKTIKEQRRGRLRKGAMLDQRRE